MNNGGLCRFGASLGGPDGRSSVSYGALSGSPHTPSREPQAASYDEQGSSKPSYPPVWRRIPLALILGFGSNGVLAWGLVYSDKSRLLGGLLCALGVGMMLSGGVLMFCLGIPSTWGWLV
jgi:hypothetical protein